MTIEIPEFSIPGQLLSPEYRTTGNKNFVNKYEAGVGTVLQEIITQKEVLPVISATLLGKVVVTEIEESKDERKTSKADEMSTKKFRISVIPKNDDEIFGNSKIKDVDSNFATHLPKEGDIVLTRVTRLSLKQASVEILAIEGTGNVLSDSGIGSNGHGNLSATGGSGGATFSIHQASSDLGETFKGIIRSQDVRSTERDRVKLIESFKPGDIVRAQILSLGDGTNYYLTTARNDLGVVFAKSHNGTGGLLYAIDWQTMVCAKTGELELRKCAKPL